MEIGRYDTRVEAVELGSELSPCCTPAVGYVAASATSAVDYCIDHFMVRTIYRVENKDENVAVLA